MEASPEGLGKVSIFFKILYYFLPYSLILYSLISDAVLGVSMYWPAPLIALGATFLNTLVSRFLTGNVLSESDLCGIPGLTNVLPSFVAPQLIVFSGTILSYIASFNTAIKSESTTLPFTTVYAPWGLFAAVIILQAYVLIMSKCLDGYYLPQFGGMIAILIGISASLAIGGGAGAGFATLPFFRSAPPGSLVLPATGNNLGPGGITPYTPVPTKSSDPNVGTCSPPNDQDQFVCEAYKNGELVTSTITEGFIGK